VTIAGMVRAQTVYDLLGRVTSYTERDEAQVVVHSRYDVVYDQRGLVLAESHGAGVIGALGGRVLKAESRIARAVRVGKEGENLAGVVGRKVGALINGRMRFPDELTDVLLKEVKNVKYQPVRASSRCSRGKQSRRRNAHGLLTDPDRDARWPTFRNEWHDQFHGHGGL
jgi:hypothetical protein